jgi:hypothetical protein
MLEKTELFIHYKIRKALMTDEAKMGLSVPKQKKKIFVWIRLNLWCSGPSMLELVNLGLFIGFPS